MNWQYGVTDTSFLDTQPDCLLAKSVMNQWSKTDPEKDKLLNQISCGGGKTGADCWNTETYKGVFGPIPDGNPLPDTTPDANGNCIWTNRSSGAKVNIGPVEPKSSQYAGQCIHNIFYCNGNGLCENKQQGAGKECVCSTGYSPDQDTNNCKKNDAPSTNFKCVFGSGMQEGRCGDSPSDWYNDNNNCGPNNSDGWCDIKHFCKDGLTAKQATALCTYNDGSNQKRGCKSTNDGGTESGLNQCNFTDSSCCYLQASVLGCQHESGVCHTDADCGPVGNCIKKDPNAKVGLCPGGTYAGKDKDGNAFTLYYTGQWNDRGYFGTYCSYSPYAQQSLALGPS